MKDVSLIHEGKEEKMKEGNGKERFGHGGENKVGKMILNENKLI